MHKLVVGLFVAVALAGCGEDGGKYPGDFMLGEDDGPSGMILLAPGMPGWDEYAAATGAEANPGELVPEKVAASLGTPALRSAHAAFFMSPIEENALVSAAVDLKGSDEAKDWLRSEVIERCLQGQYFFIKGDKLGIIFGINGVSQDKIDAAAAKVRKSSNADDLCKNALKIASDGAKSLDIGNNGPFSIDDPMGDAWFKFETSQKLQVNLEATSSSYLEMGLYTSKFTFVSSDQGDPEIGVELGTGTYYVRVAGSNTVSSFNVELDLAEA